MRTQQRQLHTEELQHFSLRIPKTLHRKIKEISTRQGKSISLFITEAIEQAANMKEEAKDK